VTLARWFYWFLDCNRRISGAIEKLLPAQFKSHSHAAYRRVVSDYVNRKPDQIIVDVGGGKECPYYKLVKQELNSTIVSLDILEDELRLNREVSLRVAADVVLSLPFTNQSTDILTSRSVIEHLYDVERYIGNCRAALKDDGCLIHSFPCKFSPFSIINRMLPGWLARRLLYTFHPQFRDECGFKAYYDHCYPSAMTRVLEKQGFEVVHEEVRYYQSIYYDFFVPLYLVMVLYDLLAAATGFRNLGCQMLFVARRRKT
jgi:ubiquinone/menaquinone biosynthesis C-methylase UbiE